MPANIECLMVCGNCSHFEPRHSDEGGPRVFCRGGKDGLLLGERKPESPCPKDQQKHFEPLEETNLIFFSPPISTTE
jgi:hypothetical protein